MQSTITSLYRQRSTRHITFIVRDNAPSLRTAEVKQRHCGSYPFRKCFWSYLSYRYRNQGNIEIVTNRESTIVGVVSASCSNDGWLLVSSPLFKSITRTLTASCSTLHRKSSVHILVICCPGLSEAISSDLTPLTSGQKDRAYVRLARTPRLI